MFCSMIKFVKAISACLVIILYSSCSQVLQSIELEVNTEDDSVQEDFKVIERTLTLKEARKQNSSPYERMVLQTGRAGRAQLIPESVAIRSDFPKNAITTEYKIGIGDILSFSRLIENNRSPANNKNEWPTKVKNPNYKLGIGDEMALTLLKEDNSSSQLNSTNDIAGSSVAIPGNKNDTTIISSGRIGSDGSVLLLEVGRLEANGKTLNELRSEVRNILIRNGVSPRFQLEISKFTSQKAYLTINANSEVIVLDDRKTTIRDILATAKVGFKPGVITRVKLQRGSKEYAMSLRDIFSDNAAEIDIISSDHIFIEDTSAEIIKNTSIVDQAGNVVFAGVGKVQAAGLSLQQLRLKISSLVELLPESDNAFQITLEQPASQKAIVNIPGKEGGVIPIGDTKIALVQVLTENGLSVNGNSITSIHLQRKGQSYIFTLDELLKLETEKVYLQDNDRVTINSLNYRDNKVFILGGVTPQIFKISPAVRETLADVLFTSKGPLNSTNAKRSDIYLLRGKQPVIAYHLDAQNPTRLIVADAMELRPNDILYVAEQPIVSFNRTLATIAPLRILLRDIQDDNIP